MNSLLELIPRGVDDHIMKYVNKIPTAVEIKLLSRDPDDCQVEDCTGCLGCHLRTFDFILLIKHGDLTLEYNIGQKVTEMDREDFLEQLKKTIGGGSVILSMNDLPMDSNTTMSKDEPVISSPNGRVKITEEIYNKVIQALLIFENKYLCEFNLEGLESSVEETIV